jgi:hypothetical protein
MTGSIDQSGERLRVVRVMLEGGEERGQISHRSGDDATGAPGS